MIWLIVDSFDKKLLTCQIIGSKNKIVMSSIIVKTGWNYIDLIDLGYLRKSSIDI